VTKPALPDGRRILEPSHMQIWLDREQRTLEVVRMSLVVEAAENCIANAQDASPPHSD
jgi:hypothetical protein